MHQVWLYTFPSRRGAADALQRLEGIPAGLTLSVGVFCAGDTPSWYVYVVSQDATANDAARIEQTLNAYGRRTFLPLSALLQTSLHLVLAGPLTLIRQGLRALDAHHAVH